MKKLLALCFIVSFFLFQSCSSYKYIDYDSVRADKNQKFKVVMLDNLKIKGSLVNKDDKNLYLTRWDGKTIKIPKEGIYDLKIKVVDRVWLRDHSKFFFISLGVNCTHSSVVIKIVSFYHGRGY